MDFRSVGVGSLTQTAPLTGAAERFAVQIVT